MSDAAIRLEDLSPEDRKALAYNDPLLDDYASRMEREFNVPSGLLVAMKNAGERSNSQGTMSVSPKGAKGVMQLMPSTVKQYGVGDPTDPLDSIRGAAQHVSWIAKKNGTQDPTLLAAAYNAGPNNMSVRRGEVPGIPETQAYVDRVTQAMQQSAPPAPPAPTLGPTLSEADLTPEDRVALTRAKMSEEYAPTKGMSRADLAWAGAGKAVSDAARGLTQLGADWMVNPASRALVGRDLMDNLRSEEAEAAMRDAPLMRTVPGALGYFGGNVASLAVPGGAAAKLGAVSKAAQMAFAVPKVGRALQIAIPAAASGITLGAMAPVSQEGERGRNIAIQGVAGPLTALGMAGLSQGARALARTAPAQRLLQAAQPAIEAGKQLFTMENLPASLQKIFRTAVVGPSVMESATPAEQAALRTAIEQEVPVYGSQVAQPGSPLSAGRTEEQRNAFSKAVSRAFGENTDDLNAAFPAARERLSNTYDTLLQNRNIPLDKSHLNDLAKITQYNSSRSPRFPPNPDLQDAVERAAAAAQQTGSMSGNDFQQALRQYTASMKQAMKGTELRPSDPHAAQGYKMLIDALTKQAEGTMGPADLAAFRQANKQWRNLHMLDALAPRDLEGNIKPAQLASVLARRDKSAFVYGTGDQTLTNLAKYGATYMEHPGAAPKGVVEKAKAMAAKSAPMLVGDLVAGAALSEGLGGGEKDQTFAQKMGSYLGWAAAAEAARRGYTSVTNPALSLQQLETPQGALARILQAGAAPAAGRTAVEENR